MIGNIKNDLNIEFSNIIDGLHKNHGVEHLSHYHASLNELAKLLHKHPNIDVLKIHLARYCVMFGYEQQACDLIDSIGDDVRDLNILQCKAWAHHFKGEDDKARSLWDFTEKYLFSGSTESNAKGVRLVQTHNLNEISDVDSILHFSCCRNEIDKLPFFLEHYRKLGVDLFFIVDNHSTDGTFEFLKTQKDVCLFSCADSFKGSGFGVAWINKLIRCYAKNNWVVHSDIDELLIYADYENKDLRILAKEMDDRGEKLMRGFALDMYPCNLNDLKLNANDPMYHQHNYFYNNYLYLGGIYPPYNEVRGGIFSVLLNGDYTVLNKTPLFKADSNIRLLSSSHVITPPYPFSLSQQTCVLMHFKLTDGLMVRVQEELQRRQHACNSKLYKGYLEFLHKTNRNFDPDIHTYSTQYRDSKQLVELGIIQAGY